MAILPQIFTLPLVASGASVTSAIQLQGIFEKCYLQVPTMAAGYTVASTPIYLKISYDGVNFFRFSNPEVTTFPAATNDYTIASSVSQRIVYIPALCPAYIQVELSANASAGAASLGQFKIITVTD